MEARDAGEGALLGRRVGEIQDAPETERDRRGDAPVPMQVRPGKLPARPLRDVEAHPIGAHPHVSVPELGKGLVNPPRVSDGSECRMLEILHHDAVGAPPVPRFRIVGRRAEMRENGRHGRLAGIRRHGIGDDDVAVFIPEGEILCRQDRGSGRDLREVATDLLGIAASGLGRIDAGDLHGGQCAGRGDDPALELLESRSGVSHILHRLLEADAERMEHQAIEMEGGRIMAPSAMAGARPGFPQSQHTEDPRIVRQVHITFEIAIIPATTRARFERRVKTPLCPRFRQCIRSRRVPRRQLRRNSCLTAQPTACPGSSAYEFRARRARRRGGRARNRTPAPRQSASSTPPASPRP